VQGQGEQAFTEKVQLATAMVAVDKAPPVIRVDLVDGAAVARVHDHQSPSRLHDWQRVWVEDAAGQQSDMHWYGEYLWRLQPAPSGSFNVCAKDRAGNQTCAPYIFGGVDDIIPPGGNGGGGGCCDAGGSPGGSLVLFALVVLSARSRRRRRGCGSAARYR
jgi:uncharacterized protein (TIGR03382 family)